MVQLLPILRMVTAPDLVNLEEDIPLTIICRIKLFILLLVDYYYLHVMS